MVSLTDLITEIKKYNSDFDQNLFKKAYIVAKGAHGNQKRHSGDPYLSHPIAVAEILIELKLDLDSVIAGLLHDVVEDTEITLQEIEEQFGPNIARLVDGVTKLGKISSIPSSEKEAENFRKLTMAISKDVRVLLIKLADRLHNMRTLYYVPSKEKRIKKAKECLDIFAPLAARIGLDKIKNELQDIAFSVIDPESRNHINDCLNDLREKNTNLTNKIINQLEGIFKDEEIDCRIYGREKKPYSIWLNMKKKNIGFHNLHDIMAFRVVTKSMMDCYKAFGVINLAFNMIPGTFKDYISTPKDNGYQSLHLVTLGPFHKKIEIQICSENMHSISENGVAAHWYYKEKHSKSSKENSKHALDVEQYRWIRELISLFESSDTASEALKDYNLSMHKNEVFCFTPDGDIFNLPYGSTIVDFAYEVHSDVGNNCSGAKVNGVIVPLRRKIENGDQIEILTSNKAKPSYDWLQFVLTSKAKVEIKHFIKNEKYEEYSILGKAILQRHFKSLNIEFSDNLIEKVLPKFRKKTANDLYFRVAEGVITKNDVIKQLYPQSIKSDKIISDNSNMESGYDLGNHNIPVSGLIDGMAIKYARCCLPIPGDEICGVLNTGVGVSIHNSKCSNVKNVSLLKNKLLSLGWKEGVDNSDYKFLCKIVVLVENSPGIFADVSNILIKKNANVKNISILNRSENYFELLIDLEIDNAEHIEDILSALLISRKVLEAKRN